MAFAFVRMFFIMPAAAFMRMPCAALAASMRFFFFVVAAAHNYLTFFKCSTSSSTSVSSLCCREFFMQTFKWFDMMFVQTPCSAPDIDDIWRSMSMHCSSPSIILCIPRTCPSIRLRRRRSCFFSLSLLQCDAFFPFFIIPYTPIPYNIGVKLFVENVFLHTLTFFSITVILR